MCRRCRARPSQFPRGASTWTGGGTNSYWSTSANWNGNIAPSFPTALTIAGIAGLTNDNILTNITVSGITFDSAAGAFALNGNRITLGGGIGFNGNPAAPITQTVNLGMAWSASKTIDTPANGNLTLGGSITSSSDTSLIKIDSGILTLGGTNTITSWDLNGGTTTITGATTINGNGNGRIYVGDGDAINNCNGALVIQPGAALAVNGSFGDTFVIDRDSGSGTVIQNGGTFTFDMGNGLMLICATSENGTTAAYDMNGGVLDMRRNSLSIGFAANGVATYGILNQAGGVITNLYNLEIPGLSAGNGLGVYTLSGGSIYIGASGITTAGGSGNYAINLGGGTVGAYASWSSSLNMNLTNLNGSVTFDTGANTITLSGQLSGNGGLTKRGPGTLILAGSNTYTGETTVEAGTLELNAPSRPGILNLASGAMLNLNFAGACAVADFYTNNVALPAGVYDAGNLPGFITGSGSMQEIELNISCSVSGSSLMLSWPTNYLGWLLQAQTNSLGANWSDVAGSANLTTTELPINPKIALKNLW